jgi:hypothetical protein
MTPQEMPSHRLTMTTKMSATLANRAGTCGIIAKTACVTLSTVAIGLTLGLIVDWPNNNLQRIGIGALLLGISLLISYGMIHLCMTVIWRGSSGYYARVNQFMHIYTRGVQNKNIDLTFIVWYLLNLLVPPTSLLFLIVTNAVGIMYILHSHSFYAIIASAIIGVITVYLAITLPIHSSHIEEDARDRDELAEKIRPLLAQEHIKMLTTPEVVGRIATPDRRNTVTGHIVDPRAQTARIEVSENELEGIQQIRSNSRRGGER